MLGPSLLFSIGGDPMFVRVTKILRSSARCELWLWVMAQRQRQGALYGAWAKASGLWLGRSLPSCAGD